MAEMDGEAQIFELNLACFHLKNKLLDHINTLNSIDLSLVENLRDLMAAINTFLENSTPVDSPLSEDIEEGLKKGHFKIQQFIDCTICDMSVDADKISLNQHVSEWNHQENLKSAGRFDDKNNESSDCLEIEQFCPISTSSKTSKAAESSTGSEKDTQEEKKQAIPQNPSAKLQTSDYLKMLLKFDKLEGIINGMIHRNNSLTAHKQLSHHRIVNDLRHTLKIRYSKLNVYLYGSQILGISDNESDLDIFIDTGTFFKKKPRLEVENMVLTAKQILKKTSNYTDFKAVTRARTPILKVFSRRENVDLDLSFGNGLSYCNTKLLLYYFELQPVARHMVLFLKFWSKQCNLPMSGYMLALLVIFFFQTMKKLPSVAYLQRFSNNCFVDGWQADFTKYSRDHLKIQQEFDLKRLLHDFFKYFGSFFDYERYIVCPYLGEPVKKAAFEQKNSNQLTGLFDRYKNYMDHLNLNKADKIQDLFAFRKPFVIQDPYEHIHNISKGFTNRQAKTFQDNCRQSWAILREQFKYGN